MNQFFTAGLASLLLSFAGIATAQTIDSQTAPSSEGDRTEANWSLLTPRAGEWPKLTLDTNSETCSGYLKAVRTAFVNFHPQPSVSLGMMAWSDAKILFDIGPDDNDSPQSVRPLAIAAAERKEQNSFALLNIDLDHDGAEESLLISWGKPSGSGALGHLNTFRINLYASSEKSATKAAFESGGATLERYAQSGVQYSGTDQLWNAPVIIETGQGTVYFTRRLSDTSDDESTLYELPASGFQFKQSNIVKTCVVEKLDKGWMGPATSRLVTHLTGARGSSCGDKKWPTYATRSGDRAVLLSNFGGRPWALSSPQDDKNTFWKSLEAWSLSDPWKRWTYRNIRESYAASVEETKERLIKTHAIQANEQSLLRLAEEITWRATGAHFVFGSDVSENLLRKIDRLQARLYRNEIATEDLASAFETVGKDPTKSENLLAVLDRPEQVAQMIALGAQSDAADEYGKTALMYAAQMDYVETVKQLISSGVNINQAKHVPRCARMQDRLQTALSYALTQSSFETIELLLEAGAKLSAQESRRPEFHWWNLRLTQEQRKMLDETLKRN